MAGRADIRKMIAALVPIYGITLIDVVGYMIMIPLLPYLAEKYGASGVTVGALLATMAVASTVAAPVWGALSDRLGRKPIVMVSQVISLIGYLALAWAPSLAMLFVARGVAGIGGGNMGVTQSYIADVTPVEYRDRAYAAFGVVFGIGIVLGPVAGGLLVHYGFAMPFIVSAGLELINIGMTIRFLPRTERGKRDGELNLREAAKVATGDPRVRSLIVRHFLFIFAVTYFFSIFALYVKHVLSFGPEHASWLIATAGCTGGIALVVVVGPLAKRLGDVLVAQIGLGLCTLAFASLGFTRTLPEFIGMLVIWAIGASCVEPTLAALLSEGAPRDKRGAVLGFNDAMSNVALMAAPSLGGWVVDRDIGMIGLIPGAATLVALIIGVIRRREDESLPTGAPSEASGT